MLLRAVFGRVFVPRRDFVDYVWNRVPVVTPRRYLGWGGHGGSRPILLETVDGRIVHVKLQHNPQSTRSLVNDWVGTLLASALGVPVPEVVLVALDRSHLDDIPILTRLRWYPGWQFGTRFLANARKFSADTPLTRLTNWSDLPLLALYELWVYNNDVKFSHLLWTPEPVPRFLMADHGFIFPGGPDWTPAILTRQKDTIPSIGPLTALARSVPLPFRFDEALTTLGAVTEDDLLSLMASVPRGWGFSGTDQKAAARFLVNRQPRLSAWARRLQRVWNSKTV